MSLPPLVYARGDTKPIEVTLVDGAGVPIPPAGHVIRFTAKRSPHDATPDAQAVIRKSSALDEVVHQGAGVYHVQMATADTEGLAATTTLVCDVEVETIATGARETANQGTVDDPVYVRALTITADVTRHDGS